MGFAEPNQILVARSYYEVVSCLSDAYAKLFHYEGSRTDKHVREHEVYAVGDSTVELKLKYEADRPALPRLIGSATTSKAVIDHLTHFPSRVTENLRTRPQLGTALAVVAILVTAVALRGIRDRPAAPMPSPEPVRPIAAAASTAAERDEAPMVPEPRLTPEPATAGTREPAPDAEKTSMPAPPKTAKAPAPAARPKPKIAKPAASPAPVVAAIDSEPAAPAGFVSFAIAPWGEIYIDGQKRGVSPPMREVELSPGQYKIEVRNTTFPTYAQTVEVEAGGRIKIRHQFR